MQGKIVFAVGVVTGYVIGTRVGRQGYERLKKQATDLWQNPQVQKTVATAGEFARDKVPVVGDLIGDLSKKASTQGDDASPRHIAEHTPGDPVIPATAGQGTTEKGTTEQGTTEQGTTEQGTTEQGTTDQGTGEQNV